MISRSLSGLVTDFTSLALVCGVVGCQPAHRAPSLAAPEINPVAVATPGRTALPVVLPVSTVAPPPQLDLDGDDEPPGEADTGDPLLPGHFERVGRAPLALQRICDLTSFGGALYAAHSNRPLGTDGATVTRYRPADPHPFSVAFDWNRAGEPSKGGGAGQGFLRVHAIQRRLFVADADPPYNGFGISEPGTEGFVFVSNEAGEFAKPRMPGHLPPRPPDAQGKAGAAVLPRAYHVIDAIRFREHIYAATGAVPPGQRAWHGASPAALLVEGEIGARFAYAADYPYPYVDGVWRFTYLVRFRDRLYAGLQDYDGREPNDYVFFSPPRDRQVITRDDLHAARATEAGTAQTVRWYADGGLLYWIAWSSEGVALRVTSDGDTWKIVSLPADLGAPTDIVRFRGALHVLTTRALLRLGDGGPTLLAHIEEKERSPFELDDSFCAAPLATFQGALFAGGQRDGALYRFREGP